MVACLPACLKNCCMPPCPRVVLLQSNSLKEDPPSTTAEAKPSWQDEAVEFAREFLPTFAFFLAIRLLIVEPRYIPSLSMYPTFDINDQLAVEKVRAREINDLDRGSREP